MGITALIMVAGPLIILDLWGLHFSLKQSYCNDDHIYIFSWMATNLILIGGFIGGVAS